MLKRDRRSRTDALLSYEGLAGEYARQVIDHAVALRGWTGPH